MGKLVETSSFCVLKRHKTYQHKKVNWGLLASYAVKQKTRVANEVTFPLSEDESWFWGFPQRKVTHSIANGVTSSHDDFPCPEQVHFEAFYPRESQTSA